MIHPELNPTLGFAFIEASILWASRYEDLPVPFVMCTYRSMEEQEKLFAQGRTSPGPIVTNARAGKSPHNYQPSFAFDVAFRGRESNEVDWSHSLFENFALIIKEIDAGGKILWGGDFESFKDVPHFELRGWQQLVMHGHDS